jgi:hypothetical protein
MTLGARGSGGPCPGGCGGTRRVGQLACGLCWGRIPPKLRTAVLRTWRARQAAPRDHAAINAHEDAKVEALAAIGGRE